MWHPPGASLYMSPEEHNQALEAGSRLPEILGRDLESSKHFRESSGSFHESSMKVQCSKTRGLCNIQLSSNFHRCFWNFHGSFQDFHRRFRKFHGRFREVSGRRLPASRPCSSVSKEAPPGAQERTAQLRSGNDGLFPRDRTDPE